MPRVVSCLIKLFFPYRASSLPYCDLARVAFPEWDVCLQRVTLYSSSSITPSNEWPPISIQQLDSELEIAISI